MRTVIVDDEKSILEELKWNLEKIEGVHIVGVFSDSLSALQYVLVNEIDLLVLDIEMPRISGIELANSLKETNCNAQVIFATGYSRYAMEAFRADAISYLMKPYSFEELKEAVEKARIMLNGIVDKKKEQGIVVQTFGKFEIFCEGKKVGFYGRKSKELLALLVDSQGGTVTMEYAISHLWEGSNLNEKTKALYRKAVSKMREALNKAECGKIVIYQRGQMSLKRELLECDFYKVLEGDKKSANMFMGNYLEDYYWAEERNGILTSYLEKNMPSDDEF